MPRDATHGEPVDRLFTKGRNVYRAAVVDVCLVKIIKIYKVLVSFQIISGVKVQLLPLRCSGVDVKVLKIGNTPVK